MGNPALEALRAQIRAIEGGPAIARRRMPLGVEAIDGLLGGLPEPGIVELSGEEGSGRFRVAFAIAAAYGRQRRPVAWIDPQSRLYPPAAADHGVNLDTLLVVCPPEDGTAPFCWATEQILRSGCFPLVVVDLPELNARVGRAGGLDARAGSGAPVKVNRRTLGHSWARAAEQGNCVALVVSRRPVRELPADVRLSVGSGSLVVVRDRAGGTGGEAGIPPWPKGACPWG